MDCNVGTGGNINYIPRLEHYGLLDKIRNVMNTLSISAESLVQHMTNNAAELFNSVICKVIGGKRIDFGKRGSYNARIYAAVLQFNTQQMLTELYKSLNHTEYDIVEALEKQRQETVGRNKIYRQTNGRTSRHRSGGPDKDYGPEARQPPLAPDVYEREKAKQMQDLWENAANRINIERETVGQSSSVRWRLLRQKMLTASNFGVVCRRKEYTPTARLVSSLLYPSLTQSKQMEYGNDMEPQVKRQLSTKFSDIDDCGLFIDQQYPFLGASPDGLIRNDGIVEIKCPYRAKGMTIETALELCKDLRNIFDPKNPSALNKKHKFYYQVQGQLHITQRQYRKFVLWSDKSMKIVHVERDDQFWEDHMEKPLTRFYIDAMLREIIECRKLKHMPIIEPEWVKKNEPKRKSKDANVCSNVKKRNANVGRKKRQNVVENVTAITTEVDPIETQTSTATCCEDIVDNVENFDNVRATINDGNGYLNEQLEWTDEPMEERLNYLDNQEAPLEEIINSLRDYKHDLSDAVMDTFLKIVRENTNLITQSVQYVIYRDIAQPIFAPSIAILGAGSSHWRALYYDGENTYLYDSLGSEIFSLVEQEYISIRFPNIDIKKIQFIDVQKQNNLIKCGTYSAAFITSIIFGDDPSTLRYKEPEILREHMIHIIERRELSRFPSCNM